MKLFCLFGKCLRSTSCVTVTLGCHLGVCLVFPTQSAFYNTHLFYFGNILLKIKTTLKLEEDVQEVPC